MGIQDKGDQSVVDGLGQVAVLNREIWVGLTDKLTLEQKFERGNGVSPFALWLSFPRGGKSYCNTVRPGLSAYCLALV